MTLCSINKYAGRLHLALPLKLFIVKGKNVLLDITNPGSHKINLGYWATPKAAKPRAFILKKFHYLTGFIHSGVLYLA